MKIEVPTEAIQQVANTLGITTAAGITFLGIALENAKLMDNKHKDYGPENISAFGPFGIVVKMHDKFCRLKHLYGTRRRKPINESILDSFRDLSNYAIIAIMLERKVWPND